MDKHLRDYEPGDLVVGRHRNTFSALKERKEDDTGWWMDRGTGLADWVVEANPDDWVFLSKADVMRAAHLKREFPFMFKADG